MVSSYQFMPSAYSHFYKVPWACTFPSLGFHFPQMQSLPEPSLPLITDQAYTFNFTDELYRWSNLADMTLKSLNTWEDTTTHTRQTLQHTWAFRKLVPQIECFKVF